MQKRSILLNHCDRISFAGCIYVFRYPKLKRAMKHVLEASDQLQGEESKITAQDQQNLAWQLIQQNGLEGVEAEKPETLVVTDYSA